MHATGVRGGRRRFPHARTITAGRSAVQAAATPRRVRRGN
jgi:hypothetical protein